MSRANVRRSESEVKDVDDRLWREKRAVRVFFLVHESGWTSESCRWLSSQSRIDFVYIVEDYPETFRYAQV